MKKLGFGCMRLPLLDKEDPTSVDFPQVCEMVDRFLAKGFTYFDTAYVYHKGESERVVKRALVDRHPRDSFTVATKLPMFSLKDAGPEDQERVFEEQLSKCGVEYFDYYLLHNLNRGSYETAKRLDSFAFVQRKKAEGKIRHIGFSFHDTAPVLDQILTDHPEVEFVQLQLNYLDWEDPVVQSRKCYETARRHGKQVVVMEPVKGGKLAAPVQEAADLFRAYDPEPSLPSWAIRYAASLEGVLVVLSGMSDLAQVEDNTGYMEEFVPLTAGENDLAAQAAQIIRGDGTVPCTGCSYCTAGCPQAIPIPGLFSLYNDNVREPGAHSRDDYAALTASCGKASACVRCGQCMEACPQHLDVIGKLKAVAITFEE